MINHLFISLFRISEPSGDAEDLSLLSPEEREKRRSFEAKRNIFTCYHFISLWDYNF